MTEEKIKQNKLAYLNNIRAAIVRAMQEDLGFETEQFCKGHTILGANENEELNSFMNRIWETKQKTGDEVSATFEELQITTAGMRDVNDMHASALEDVYTGPYGAIFKGLDEAISKVSGNDFYVKHIMDKSVTEVNSGDGAALDKIEKAMIQATSGDEKFFRTILGENGDREVQHIAGENINEYMQRIWDEHETTGEHAFGILGKMHIETHKAKDVNDMHATALENEVALLSAPYSTVAPVWTGLKIARHLNNGSNFHVQQLGYKVNQKS